EMVNVAHLQITTIREHFGYAPYLGVNVFQGIHITKPFIFYLHHIYISSFFFTFFSSLRLEFFVVVVVVAW
ncbi:hypothetical protein ACJX0J_011245, partial [Zea mays]